MAFKAKQLRLMRLSCYSQSPRFCSEDTSITSHTLSNRNLSVASLFPWQRDIEANRKNRSRVRSLMRLAADMKLKGKYTFDVKF